MAELNVVIRAIDQASAVFDSIDKAGGNAMNALGQNATKVGLAMAGAGAAIEAYARLNRELNVEVDKLATRLQMTDKEMRNLITSTRGVGDPLQEVVDLMTLAAQQGVTGADNVAKFSESWDKVADATGGSATTMAKNGVALRAVGIDANNVEKAYAAFGTIQQNTTIGVEAFIGSIGRMAPMMKESGASVDDAAKMLAFMESKGITSRKAMAELNSAMKESGGDLKKVYEAIGMTAEEQEIWNQKLKENATYIEDNAKKWDESFTPLQRIQTQFENIAFSMSDQISNLAVLSPLLTGVGGVLVVLGQSGLLATGGLAAASAGIATVGTTILVCLPWLAAIVAAVALLYLAWTNNWGGIQEKTKEAVGFLQDRFKSMTDGLADAGKSVWDAMVKISSAIQESFGKVQKAIKEVIGVDGFDILTKVIRILGLLWDDVWKGVGIVIKLAADVVVKAVDFVCKGIDKLIDIFNELKKNPVFGFLIDAAGKFGNAMGTVLDKVGGFLEKSGDNMDKYAGKYTKAQQAVIDANVLAGKSVKEATDAMDAELEETGDTATDTGTAVKTMAEVIAENMASAAESVKTSAAKIIADFNSITGSQATALNEINLKTLAAEISAQEGRVASTKAYIAANGNNAALQAELESEQAGLATLKSQYGKMQGAGSTTPVGSGRITGSGTGTTTKPRSEMTIAELQELDHVGDGTTTPAEAGYVDTQAGPKVAGSEWMSKMLGAGITGGLQTGSGSGYADNLVAFSLANGGVATTTDYKSFQSYANEEDARAGRGGTQFSKADYEAKQTSATQKAKTDAENTYLKERTDALNETLKAELAATEERINKLKKENDEEIAKSKAALELKLKRQQEEVDIAIARQRNALERKIEDEHDEYDAKLAADKSLTAEEVRKKKADFELQSAKEREALEEEITKDKEDRDLKIKREWEDFDAKVDEKNVALQENLQKEKDALDLQLLKEAEATVSRIATEDIAMKERLKVLADAAAQAAALTVAGALKNIGYKIVEDGSVVSQSYSAYTVPKMASGGTISRGGSAIVGEAGAELLNLPAGASVTPLSSGGDVVSLLKQILAKLEGGSGVTIQAGTIVADKGGLRELERRLQGIRVSENVRMGV